MKLFEMLSLESRKLFAADFAVAITGTTLTDSVDLSVKKIPTFTASLSVSNVGTALGKKEKETVAVSVVLHSSGGSDIVVGKAKLASSKFANGAVAQTFKFKQPKGLVAGTSYTLQAAIAVTGGAAADPAGNNSVSGKTTTATNGGGGSTTNPTGVLASIGLGSVITFKKTGGTTTSNGFGNETGTFKDNAGKTGTYNLVLGTGGLLSLKDSAGTAIGFGSTTVVANANSGTPRVGGHTLTFGVAEVGATGYAQFGGISGHIFYKG